jgi:hypothetical protein
MSVPSAWPQVVDLFDTSLVIEQSPVRERGFEPPKKSLHLVNEAEAAAFTVGLVLGTDCRVQASLGRFPHVGVLERARARTPCQNRRWGEWCSE